MLDFEYCISAIDAVSDELYLSAVFKDNKLVSISQNKKVSSEVKIEDIAEFLLAIKSEERYYPADISNFIKNNVIVREAENKISDNYIKLAF